MQVHQLITTSEGNAMILCIETATDICSVALSHLGKVVAQATDDGKNRHIEQLTSMINQVVDQVGYQSLTAVAISEGPGGYTSLRVGTSVAKGLCYGLNIPLIGVGTLEALAWASGKAYAEAHPDRTFWALPMLDARRDEVCMEVYDAFGILKRPLFQHFVSNNMFDFCSAFSTENDVLLISGNGTLKCSSVLFDQNTVISGVVNCSASHIAAIAYKKMQNNDFQQVTRFSPVYMKSPMITQSKKNTF
jgi:tRNA threonylcarbamoyladenosine biosynthesis protein TsaB